MAGAWCRDNFEKLAPLTMCGHAGEPSDFNRRRLFCMRPDDAEWDRHRWRMVQQADNPASLPGVVPFLAKALAVEVPNSKKGFLRLTHTFVKFESGINSLQTDRFGSKGLIPKYGQQNALPASGGDCSDHCQKATDAAIPYCRHSSFVTCTMRSCVDTALSNLTSPTAAARSRCG